MGAVLNQQSARDGQAYGYAGYDGSRDDEVVSEPSGTLPKPVVMTAGPRPPQRIG